MDPYCAYDATHQSSCEFETSPPYEDKSFCIQATDNAGNTNSRCGDWEFTVKAGIGDPCDTGRDCIIGTCDDNICQPDTLLPPELFIK